MSNTAKSAVSAVDNDADKRPRVLPIFIGLLVAMLLAALDQTVFSTALPTIVGELHGVEHMLWVTTAYILASTIMMPVYSKLGDRVNRKMLFIIAIVLFLVGSVVGGLAQNMTWLIIGRGIQGIGGGGLMILAQAIIAHVIPAKERGKYMGVMGLAFAVPSVAGPLLGGWFTESIGWRWVFWINIPMGILALASAVIFLPSSASLAKRLRVDWAGIGLLATASTTIVLVTTWGGSTYPWNSPVILLLAVAAVISVVAFIFVERRAADPVMPGNLFKDRTFNLVTITGLITGIAMFGALAYTPTYMQMVTGSSATKSGLLMTPMMGGLLLMSIAMGQVTSRRDHYKWIPITGTAVVAVGLLLLSTMTVGMPIWQICVYMALLGAGLGMSMQTLVLIVQNQFPVEQVSTATGTNNYFRQMGASLGAALVGSLFVANLKGLLADRLPSMPTTGDEGVNSLTPAVVKSLPPEIHDTVISAYSNALTPIFLLMVPFVLVAFVLLWFLKEKPLSKVIVHEAAAESLEIDGSSFAFLPPSAKEDTSKRNKKAYKGRHRL